MGDKLFAYPESQIIRWAPTRLRSALHWMDVSGQFQAPAFYPHKKGPGYPLVRSFML